MIPEEGAVSAAQVASAAEVFGGGEAGAAFHLKGLEEEACNIAFGEGALEGVEVAEWDFDVVLVNAPPFLPSADAAHLASAAGAAVVVVPDGASVTDYEELVRRLDLAAATPIGYVYCCSDCDVPSPQNGTGDRLKRALHVESSRAPLQRVSGLKPTS